MKWAHVPKSQLSEADKTSDVHIFKAEYLSHFKKAIKSELKTLKKEYKKNEKQRSRYLLIACPESYYS